MFRKDPATETAGCLSHPFLRAFDYKDLLRYYLAQCNIISPTARAAALEKYMGRPGDDLRRPLKSPNNILAIEYLKALDRLQSGIVPLPSGGLPPGITHSPLGVQLPALRQYAAN